MAQRNDLKKLVLSAIAGQTAFNDVALALFAYQYERSPTLRSLCERAGIAPDSTEAYTEIPPVTADLFRFVRLYAPAQPASHVFRTSGTTSGARGEHHVADLDVYLAGVRAQVAKYLVADGVPRPALVLAPSPRQLPDSSLSTMLQMIVDEFASSDGLFAWDDVGGLDLDSAIEWLRARHRTAEPVQILATSSALVYLTDELQARNLTFELPAGSVLMPTGGNKGKTRDFDQHELERELRRRVGLADDRIVTEYGMTELISQFWDPVFADDLAGKEGPRQRTLVGPPWCRVDVVDPETLDPVADGIEGILVFTDLGNIDSAMRVQTADVGSKIGERKDGSVEIVLAGRAAGARPRGCSLTAEESRSEQKPR